MAKLETRTTVGLRAPRSRPRFPGPLRGVTAHWNGPAMRLRGRPHSECRARWRGIQTFHMSPGGLGTTNGAMDVAYTAAVCHHGIVLEGRGVGVRTGANGTTAGNNGWYALFFMLGGNEDPSAEMLRAADWYARNHLKTTDWNRHTDHKATSCAGTVNKYVRNGRLIISGSTSGPRILAYQDPHMTGSDVRSWQGDLRTWRQGVGGGPDPVSLDGVFGRLTRNETIRFMRAVMDVETEDPRVGPRSRKAMAAWLQRNPKTKP